MNMLELLHRNTETSKAIALELGQAEIYFKQLAELVEKRLTEDRVLINALIGELDNLIRQPEDREP